MTVKELIDKLKGLDPDLQVFTAGYEGGYHYAEVSENPKIESFCLNYNSPDEWWYGPHEAANSVHSDIRSDFNQVTGIVL